MSDTLITVTLTGTNAGIYTSLLGQSLILRCEALNLFREGNLNAFPPLLRVVTLGFLLLFLTGASSKVFN